MSTEIEQKLFTLVQKLHAKTLAGGVVWERTSTNNAFQTSFPTFVVRLYERWEDGAESPDYVISIRDESGLTVERASDVELTKAIPNCNAFAIMRELYTMARRQALNVDSALDSLLAELE
jgi:hypothetical protein